METITLVNMINDGKPIGNRTKRRPKNRWRDDVINYLRKLNSEIRYSSLKMEKPGIIWCRRPKPMQGCGVRIIIIIIVFVFAMTVPIVSLKYRRYPAFS